MKLTPDLTNIINLSVNINEAYSVKKKIIAIAAGYAAACNIPMLSSAVTNPHEHFTSTHVLTINRWISAINEVAPMDVAGAVENARKFWMMRYSAVYECPMLEIVENDFFQSLFGAPRHFDAETIQVLNQHNKQIAPLYRAICLYIKEAIDPAA